MQKHKFNIFPEIEGNDFQRLVSDIKENGYDKSQPIVIFEGAIIDGWNRYRACKSLNVTPTQREFEGAQTEAIDFIMRTNKRRNLTSSQWACIAVEADELIAVIKAETEQARRESQADEQSVTKIQLSGNKLPDSKKNVTVQSGQLIPPSSDKPVSRLTSSQSACIAVEADELIADIKAETEAPTPPKKPVKKNPDKNKTATKVAKKFNTNKQYIKDATKLKEEDPEAFEAVLSGKTTITKVKRVIKEKKREARREENREKVAQVAEPEKIIKSGIKFSTIVIDPPWDWKDEGDNDQLGRAKPDYSTMTLDQLLELPVNTLADDDCHLYMWITNRSLPKGFQLLEKWGFRYITALTWVKPSFGLGNYFRGQTEHILFGVKGSQALKRKDVGTVFNAPRGKKGHSSKPDEVYELVESCSPGPYLEMFSRSDREDWTTWGENA